MIISREWSPTPAELRFLRLTASARPRAGGGDCAWVSQSLRSRKGHRNTPFQPIGSPYHTMEGKGKTAETYARRAQEICAVRDPRSVEATNSDDARPSPVAIIGRLRRPKHASISRVRCRGPRCLRSLGRAAGERAGSRRGSRRRTTGSVSPRGRRSASPGREGTRQSLRVFSLALSRR